jgi:hypothetical protein
VQPGIDLPLEVRTIWIPPSSPLMSHARSCIQITNNVMRYNARVIVSFANRGTEEIFNGTNTKDARNICPQGLWPVAHRKLGAAQPSRWSDLHPSPRQPARSPGGQAQRPVQCPHQRAVPPLFLLDERGS